MRADHRVIFGDALEVLRSLDSESADCGFTSPPYFNLRSYSDDPRELGKEKTIEEYVARLVAIFAEVRRVLKPWGTLALVLGDSYAGAGKHRADRPQNMGKQSRYAGHYGEAPGVLSDLRADLANVHEVARKLKRPSCELSGARNDIGAVWAPEPGAVAAVQIASGGMGIDLTAARYGVYYSLGFSYGEYMQSRARLRRPGQTRTVFVYHLLATAGGGETVDHDVMAAIGRKEETVEGVLERMRGRQR